MKDAKESWKPEEPADVNVRSVLPDMVRAYFHAGRKLDRDSKAKAMHRFRLKTKHLRYTLEAFVSLYGPSLERRIATLRPIQNALGDSNDCEVLLAEMGDRLPHKVRAWLHKRSDEKRKDFLRYWRETFDAAGEDKKWEKYLARTRSVRKPQTKP